MTRLGLIPLDNRPVCLQLPQQVAAFAGWSLQCPPAHLLAVPAIKQPVNRQALLRWVSPITGLDAWVWSADMLAYGGLIPSRVGFETEADCQGYLNQALAGPLNTVPGYAFSSILRIPNYNLAEEEPDYWASYGQALYQYSERQAQGLRTLTKELPDSVVQNFLTRRARNFAVNQWLASQMAAYPNALGYLAFCQDDTGPVGLNVNEANTLKTLLPQSKGLVKTGADELAVCLMVRAALDNTTPRVQIIYGDDASQQTIMPFDGQPLADVVTQTLQLCGVVPVTADADVTWIIHAARTQTGDHMEGRPAKGQDTSLSQVMQHISRNDQPVCLADVAYANGGDPALTHWLLSDNHWQGLSGYAAWNTPGNTLGSSLAMGLAHWYANKTGTFQPHAFIQALTTRLLDDGIYQGILRQQGREQFGSCTNAAQDWLNDHLNHQAKAANLPACHAQWPCNRWFEIELTI